MGERGKGKGEWGKGKRGMGKGEKGREKWETLRGSENGQGEERVESTVQLS